MALVNALGWVGHLGSVGLGKKYERETLLNTPRLMLLRLESRPDRGDQTQIQQQLSGQPERS